MKERMKLIIFTLRQSILDGNNINLSENILSKHIEYSLLNQHKQLHKQNQISPNVDFVKNRARTGRWRYYAGVHREDFNEKIKISYYFIFPT
jgi:hypothetical protein